MRYVCIGSWGISFFTLTQLHTDGGISKKKWNFFLSPKQKKINSIFLCVFLVFFRYKFLCCIVFFFAFLVLEFIFHEKNRYSTPFFFSLLNGLLCHFSTLFFTTQNFIFFYDYFFFANPIHNFLVLQLYPPLSLLSFVFARTKEKSIIFFYIWNFFSYIIKYIRLIFCLI